MKYLIEHAPVNPTFEYADGIKLPKGTTSIEAKGGGSTIDVAKWVADKYKLPLHVIPTTAGTGSEVTRYCVLNTDGKKKTYEVNKPTSYILDPHLVVTLPKLHTLSSGLDAFAQSLESIWSKNATAESMKYATSSMDLIQQNLTKSLEEPENLEARMNMLIAANLSGRAIEITKTNVCHAISYPLTDLYDIPHGIACALTLPYFAFKVKIDIRDFIKQLKLPRYKLDKEKIADMVINSEKLKDYPLEITREDVIHSLV